MQNEPSRSSSPIYAQDAILTLKEAAAYLGGISAETVRLHCVLPEGDPDRIPNFKMGTRYRIPFWALRQWVAQRAGCAPPPELPEKLKVVSY